MSTSTRDAYVDKMKAKLDEWNAELDALEAKVRGASADARVKYERQINIARSHRDEIHGKLDELRDSSEGAWDDLKQGVEDACDRLATTVSDIRKRFE